MTAPAAQRLSGLLSSLFVPAGNTKLLKSASEKAFSAVVVDLEDAVPADEKQKARAGLADDVRLLRTGVKHVTVRINKPWTMLLPDIAAAVNAGADAIMVPKVERDSDVRIVAEILDEISPVGREVTISQIESALGLQNLASISHARPDRHAAIMLGPEDLARDLRAESSREVMTPHAQALVTAARSAGLLAIGSPGSIAEIVDMEAYRSQLAAGKRMGFDAVVAIHPKQVSIIEEVFRPTAEEISIAKAIVEGDKLHKGRPFTLNGKMIDAPIVARARNVLKSAG